MDNEIKVRATEDNGTYFVEDVEERIQNMLDARARGPRNRKERRKLMKKIGKTRYNQMNLINDTAKKLDYIKLIEGLRKLNEKKENKDEQATVKNN